MEVLRELMRQHPGACPFPFTMLRLEPDATRACPQPDGPLLDASEVDAAWNSDAMTSLRRDYLEGRLPSACRGCSLYPRLGLL